MPNTWAWETTKMVSMSKKILIYILNFDIL